MIAIARIKVIKNANIIDGFGSVSIQLFIVYPTLEATEGR